MPQHTHLGKIAVASLILAGNSFAEHVDEEVLVFGTQNRLEMEVSSLDAAVPDSAAMLRKLPGANVNSNGPVSGIHQYRGMFGTRVNVNVDGMHIAPGGPNLMDAPLSYAPAAMLESLTIYRGVAPVSVAQESIGGAIIAETAKGDFGDTSDFGVNGAITAGGQSVNNGWLGNALLAITNEHHKIYLNGLAEAGDDAKFPDGKIRPSEYERKRIDAGYAWQSGSHLLDISTARNETGYAGNPALPMDIAYIDSNLYQGKYRYGNDHWALEASLHGNEVDHLMTNNHLRTPPASLMAYRDAYTTSDALGYKLMAEFYSPNAVWRVGTDGQQAVHNADISNPNNASFFVVNFNDSEREVLGLFGETDIQFSSAWELNAGIRYNQVSMDSDTVAASMAMMSPAILSLQQQFNSADRSTTDNNIDWLLRANWSPSSNWTYTAAIARKTRSAAYQEKYLWLPLQSSGGLADGKNYIGDIDLKPEVAHEIELGFDWESETVLVSPRIFYRNVDDYIQGVPSTNAAANMVSGMMGNPDPLQFANVEATIYGFDMEWGVAMNQLWSLYGIVNYIRGERDDIDDNLYRIAPPNTTLGLRYEAHRWQANLETVAYARQSHVSTTNDETETAGHAIINFASQVNLVDSLTLAIGIDNLLDRNYSDHLNGINRAINEDIARGDKLPGWGRNVYARLRWAF
jgi:iron complex outermembrane receptor protein